MPDTTNVISEDIDIVIKRRQAMFTVGRLYRDSALSVAEEVSVPDFRATLEKQGIRSVHFLLHSLARASLQIPQFRLRIRNKRTDREDMDTEASEEIVAVNADNLYCSYVVQNPHTDINHCTVLFDYDLASFAARAQRQEPTARGANEFILSAPDPDGINAIGVSIIPWLRLNSLVHGSSAPIPMFTIGKFIPRGECLAFTLCTLINHRLVDAYHIHQLIEQFCLNVSAYVEGR